LAYDVGITFLASVVTLPLALLLPLSQEDTLAQAIRGLYWITPTIYGIAMLVAAFGIPAAMNQVCGAVLILLVGTVLKGPSQSAV
jgi:hypothetical protein